MGKWSEANLKSQYRRAKSAGWIPFFVAAGDAIPDDDIDAATLMAIASRETNMQNIRGDFRDGVYHGYSLMQLDIGSHPDWIRSGAWRDARQAIDKGADALNEKREQVVEGQGRELVYKGQRFTGKRLDEARIKHTALAAYNSGLGAYYSITVNGDPDKRTTGHDYGRDVLERERVFRRLLEADGLVGNGSAPDGGSAPDASGASGDGESLASADASAAAAGTTTAVAQTTTKVTAGSGSWLRAVTTWISAQVTSQTEHFGRFFDLSPENQRLVFWGIVIGGAIYLVLKAAAEWQVRRIHSDPALKNVK